MEKHFEYIRGGFVDYGKWFYWELEVPPFTNIWPSKKW
jgi:hypothetical protein